MRTPQMATTFSMTFDLERDCLYLASFDLAVDLAHDTDGVYVAAVRVIGTRRGAPTVEVPLLYLAAGRLCTSSGDPGHDRPADRMLRALAAEVRGWLASDAGRRTIEAEWHDFLSREEIYADPRAA